MQYTLKDFLKLRETILKNDMLCTLLIATYTHVPSSEPIVLARTQLTPTSETISYSKAHGKPIKGKLITYDIVVKSISCGPEIGIRYQEQPIIWLRRLSLPDKSEIGRLKEICNSICNYYSPYANDELKLTGEKFNKTLAKYNLSQTAWKNGHLGSKVKRTTYEEASELDAYYAELEQYLYHYRVINKLLIRLIKLKQQTVKFYHEKERLFISSFVMKNSVLIGFQNHDKNISEIFILDELRPKNFDSSTHQISPHMLEPFLS